MKTDPLTRFYADVDKYADMLLYRIGDEWKRGGPVRDSRSLTVHQAMRLIKLSYYHESVVVCALRKLADAGHGKYSEHGCFYFAPEFVAALEQAKAGAEDQK